MVFLLLLIILEEIAANASIWKSIYPSCLLLLEEYLIKKELKKKNVADLELHPFQIRKKETSKSGICLPSVPLFNDSLTIVDRKNSFILLISLETHRLAIYLYFMFPAFIKTSQVGTVLGNILGSSNPFQLITFSAFIFQIPEHLHPFHTISDWKPSQLLMSVWKQEK